MAPVTRSSARMEIHEAVAVAAKRKSKLAALSLIKIHTMMHTFPRLSPTVIVHKKEQPKRLQRSVKKSRNPSSTLGKSINGQKKKSNRGAAEPEEEDGEDVKYDIPKVPVQMAIFPSTDESAHLFVKHEVEVSTEPVTADAGIIDPAKKIPVPSEESKGKDSDEDSGDQEEDTLQAVTDSIMNSSMETLGHPRHTSTPIKKRTVNQDSIEPGMNSVGPCTTSSQSAPVQRRSTSRPRKCQ